MHALLVWWSDRACGAVPLKSWSVCQKRATRLCIHSWNVPHPLSDVSVPLADGGAISHTLVPWVFWRHLQWKRYSQMTSLQWSYAKKNSLHFGSLDAITLRRRPIPEVDAETQEVVSNSGHEQEFCLFDHMWKFGTSSANMHNEVAPERGPPPAAVAEERWKLFSLIEEGLTRRDAVASMLREQRVQRPGCFVTCRDVLSPCAIIPGLSWLQRTRPGVLPCRPRALREAVRVHRVRITPAHWQWRPSWWTPTPSCGGLACPTPSCTFDNILPGSAQFKSGRGNLEALQCHGVDVVGATCLLSARKPLRCGQRRAKWFLVTFVSVSANAMDAINAGEFFLKKNYSFWKFENKSPFFVSQENPFFLMRRRLLCVIESSLEHTASCGDVVERVKSTYVQLSLIWSAVTSVASSRLPFYSVFFFLEKRKTQENKLNRKRSKREKTEQSFSTRFLRNILIFSEKKKEDDLKGRVWKKTQTYFQKRVSKKEIRKQLDFCRKRMNVWAKLTAEKKIIWEVQEHFFFFEKKKLVLFYILFSSVWSLLLLSFFFMSCFFQSHIAAPPSVFLCLFFKLFFCVNIGFFSEFSHFCFMFFFVFNVFLPLSWFLFPKHFWSLLHLLSFLFNFFLVFRVWNKNVFRKRRFFLEKKIVTGVEKNQETCRNKCIFFLFKMSQHKTGDVKVHKIGKKEERKITSRNEKRNKKNT